ncbi:hypothetical protein HMPREF9123_0595 [Neisseria bacilliformis ATCC BAA-1200]|uniref:Uncharacterized protein n=1 Tax=Neisseria bacilliformis ATCC BAA-1200 TaxID=888742 RepID=F2BA41_9NEIS|nr:hypothetical protein HMPREF9123_0595 [Neisseria bacilliformis ATCC BAA-1200]
MCVAAAPRPRFTADEDKTSICAGRGNAFSDGLFDCAGRLKNSIRPFQTAYFTFAHQVCNAQAAGV